MQYIIFIKTVLHSSQKLSPQQGIITAFCTISLQILQVSSGGTTESSVSIDNDFLESVANALLRWINKSMDGWMDQWMDGWINGWVNGWMDRSMDGCIDQWIDQWMDEW